jgi:hypothetical protein
MEFWNELSQKSPSLSHLDSIGLGYQRSVLGAERGFQTVLQLDPKCVATMRGYAQFLVDVRLGFSRRGGGGGRLPALLPLHRAPHAVFTATS